MANEQKKEQDTDLETPPPCKWQFGRSPTMTRTPESSWAGAQMIGEDMEVEVIPEGSARGEPVCVNAIVSPKGAAPTKLSERRSTTTTAILEGPPGNSAIARTAADGHSIGVDHPPSAGEAGLGVSFGEVPAPHQLQLGERGGEGVLSTPFTPLHTGLHGTGTTSPRSKSPVLAPRARQARGGREAHGA